MPDERSRDHDGQTCELFVDALRWAESTESGILCHTKPPVDLFCNPHTQGRRKCATEVGWLLTPRSFRDLRVFDSRGTGERPTLELVSWGSLPSTSTMREFSLFSKYHPPNCPSAVCVSFARLSFVSRAKIVPSFCSLQQRRSASAKEPQNY